METASSTTADTRKRLERKQRLSAIVAVLSQVVAITGFASGNTAVGATFLSVGSVWMIVAIKQRKRLKELADGGRDRPTGSTV